MHLFWHRVFVVATASLTPPVPLGPNAPMGWPKRKKAQAILFVADSKKGVLMYDPNDANSSPEGSITTGVDYPDGIAVDNTGALYVSNLGSNTVTVYPAGMNSPSLTISTGINQPYGIGVDSKGDVFVSNLGNNTVTAYQAGGTAPYETISFYSYGQPTGIGVDAHDNVSIACDSTNKVYEIAAGSSQPRGVALKSLDQPIGISFGEKDEIFVSNYSGSNLNVYEYGKRTPSAQITHGIEDEGPGLAGVTSSDTYFQSNEADDVVGYRKGKTSLHGASRR